MELSKQEFCSTTAMMVDRELPPSSHFCVPDDSGTLLYTSGGDVISSKCTIEQQHVRMYNCWIFVDNPPTPITPFNPHGDCIPTIELKFPFTMKHGFVHIDIPDDHMEEMVGQNHPLNHVWQVEARTTCCSVCTVDPH